MDCRHEWENLDDVRTYSLESYFLLEYENLKLSNSFNCHEIWSMRYKLSRSMTQFFSDPPYSRIEKIMLICLRLFMNIAVVACLTVSSTFSLLTVFLPCQPGLVSSIMCTRKFAFIFSSPCKPGMLVTFATSEFLVCLQIGMGAMFNMIILLLIGITFQWIESGSFFRKYHMGTADQVGYREVQIFEKLLNSCTRDRIFLKMALLMPSLQILLSFVAISMYQSSEVGPFTAGMFLSVYLLTLAFTLQAFSAAAQVNESSLKWIESCKERKANKFQSHVILWK